MMPNVSTRHAKFSCCLAGILLWSCLDTGAPAPAAPPYDPDIALLIVDYLLNQQDANGAIPDVPNGETVNIDSNMEYALIGFAAAYHYAGSPAYLSALELGIRWLAAAEEMTDAQWRGSWFYAYSSVPPYQPVPTSPDDPAIMDVRGVDATSALFVYLLYLHSVLSGSDALAQEYDANARAALDFVLAGNQSPDGFFYSSWQRWVADGEWHLWPFCYAADQADVYLGMRAGWELYGDTRYRDAAGHLEEQVPGTFFLASDGRYAVGMYEDGSLASELDGFDGVFPQGYLPWVFGANQYNLDAFDWLSACVQADGSLVCYPGDPRFSMSVLMYAMSATGLSKPFPTQSVDWLINNTLDGDGGIRDTADPASEKYPNVAGFGVAALLGYQAFPAPAGSVDEGTFPLPGLALAVYPTPSAGAVEILVSVVRPISAEIDILDAAGRRVRLLGQRMLREGVHVIHWDRRSDDGLPLASGVYFVRGGVGGRYVSHRIVLLR